MSEKNRTETENWMTTECPDPKDDTSEQFHSILFKFLIPIIVVVASVSTWIYFALRKRRLDQLRHRLVPFYKFDPAECEDDWQTDLMDEVDNQRPFTKLQDYKSTSTAVTRNCDEKPC